MQFAPPKKIHVSAVTGSDSRALRPLQTPARVQAKFGDKNAVQGDSVRAPTVKARAKAVVKAKSKAKASPIPRTAGVSNIKLRVMSYQW